MQLFKIIFKTRNVHTSRAKLGAIFVTELFGSAVLIVSGNSDFLLLFTIATLRKGSKACVILEETSSNADEKTDCELKKV